MHSQNPTRRAFLKTGAVGAAVISAPSLSLGGPDTRRLKIGLIGCGGRGTGAAGNALGMDTNSELHAVADLTQNAITASLTHLQKFKDRAQVDPKRQFIGLDGYQKVLESNPDVVILATPPGFRPLHFKAAVEAGKHIFCEKPVAVDVTGVRSVMESARKAKDKGLSVVSGFCWRYSAARRAAFKKILEEDAIGKITHYYATYYTGPVKPMPPLSSRPDDMSDVAWQIQNWYNFSWLSGDSLVEQAIHSVDKTCWALGDQNPLSCMGNGGRQHPMEGCNIYDHFNVVYDYPGNVLVTVANRQIPRCDYENADYITGTKGTCILNGNRVQIIGEKPWTYDEEQMEKDLDMYDQEHVELFDSIRNGRAKNDGEWMTHSTLVGIMGRMAAYTGKRITWQMIEQSDEDLAPEETFTLASSFTPHSLPVPGIYTHGLVGKEPTPPKTDANEPKKA